jgi:glycosyltransferase involved in cell wall biosynthesis
LTCRTTSSSAAFGFVKISAAQNCRTPVVAADGSSLSEVVGDAGLLVAPGDVAGWARAIEAVLANPERAGRMVELGAERAARYSWARSAEATAAVYRRALSGTAQAAGLREVSRGRA